MIEVRRVSKSFGRVQALSDVSLSIARGERVALVGSNGSGKTTLLRSLLGLYRVRGSIVVDSVDVSRSPERALGRIAYVPQIAPPLDAPVHEVVRALATLRKIPETRIFERALRLGLDVSRVAALRFRELSGGMKQKFLAACALAVDADVLICDEPTANLDSQARSSFFAQIAELPADRTLIVCSHRIDEVRNLVGRVIELGEGRVVRDVRLPELSSIPSSSVCAGIPSSSVCAGVPIAADALHLQQGASP